MPENITVRHGRIEKDPESLLVELKRRTAEQKAILSSMVVGVAIYDRSGYMVSLNPAGSKMMGLTESDLPKHYGDVLSALHMEDWEGRPISHEKTSVARALKGMTVKDYQFTVLLKNLERRWLLGSASPIRSEEGEITGVVLTIVDATEQKQAEEMAAAVRQRLFTVLETLPIMICLLTPDYHVAFANRSFRERFGESHGRHCYEYCFGLGRSKPCEFCEAYRVLETGQPHQWEITSPDGSTLVAHDYPFNDVDGSPMILEMAVDITERKRLEEELRQSERLSAVGKTAGMVGHDLRNPLQAIAGNISLMKEMLAFPSLGPAEREGLSRNVEEISGQVRYMDKIVSDLQDYTRSFRPVITETDLMKQVKGALSTVRVPGNVDTVLTMPEGFTARVDPLLMRRALTNLINNAVQAMPDGGRLTISAYRDGGGDGSGSIITVEDTGVGIRDEDKPKIFTPLFSTKSKGQGLGLAVSKRLVEAHNGTLTFESEYGKGTKFTIRIP